MTRSRTRSAQLAPVCFAAIVAERPLRLNSHFPYVPDMFALYHPRGSYTPQQNALVLHKRLALLLMANQENPAPVADKLTSLLLNSPPTISQNRCWQTPRQRCGDNPSNM